MTHNQILNNIFKIKEILIKNSNKAFLDSEEIDYDFIKMLILSDILDFDGGNFDFNEKYYRLNSIFYKDEKT